MLPYFHDDISVDGTCASHEFAKSEDYNAAMKPPKVLFHDKVRYRKIPSFRTYSAEQAQNLWMTPDDIQNAKMDAVDTLRAIRKLNLECDNDDHCLLGLEGYTRGGKMQRAEWVGGGLDIVLTCQSQRASEEDLSLLYQESSKESSEAAQARALQTMFDVRDVCGTGYGYGVLRPEKDGPDTDETDEETETMSQSSLSCHFEPSECERNDGDVHATLPVTSAPLDHFASHDHFAVECPQFLFRDSLTMIRDKDLNKSPYPPGLLEAAANLCQDDVCYFSIPAAAW